MKLLRFTNVARLRSYAHHIRCWELCVSRCGHPFSHWYRLMLVTQLANPGQSVINNLKCPITESHARARNVISSVCSFHAQVQAKNVDVAAMCDPMSRTMSQQDITVMCSPVGKGKLSHNTGFIVSNPTWQAINIWNETRRLMSSVSKPMHDQIAFDEAVRLLTLRGKIQALSHTRQSNHSDICILWHTPDLPENIRGIVRCSKLGRSQYQSDNECA